MLIAYCNNAFPTDYVPTVFDNYSANVQVNRGGQKLFVSLSLWDFAHREDSARLRPLSYPQTHVIMLCYPSVYYLRNPLERIEEQVRKEKFAKFIVRSRTYACAIQWYPELSKWMPRVPIILVRTKSDLDETEPLDTDSGNNGSYQHPTRKHSDAKIVTWEAAEELKKKIAAAGHVAVSAYKGKGLKVR